MNNPLLHIGTRGYSNSFGSIIHSTSLYSLISDTSQPLSLTNSAAGFPRANAPELFHSWLGGTILRVFVRFRGNRYKLRPLIPRRPLTISGSESPLWAGAKQVIGLTPFYGSAVGNLYSSAGTHTAHGCTLRAPCLAPDNCYSFLLTKLYNETVNMSTLFFAQ